MHYVGPVPKTNVISNHALSNRYSLRPRAHCDPGPVRKTRAWQEATIPSVRQEVRKTHIASHGRGPRCGPQRWLQRRRHRRGRRQWCDWPLRRPLRRLVLWEDHVEGIAGKESFTDYFTKIVDGEHPPEAHKVTHHRSSGRSSKHDAPRGQSLSCWHLVSRLQILTACDRDLPQNLRYAALSNANVGEEEGLTVGSCV